MFERDKTVRRKQAIAAMLILLSWISSGATAAEPQSVADGKIHAVEYSHEDLGYANYPHVLRTENRLENLFRAVRYCDQTADWPFESQYRYQQETADPLPYFLSVASPGDRAKLARYIREGRIAIAATHTTVLTDRLNSESAARLFYVAGRHLPDLLGVDSPKVAMIDDVTGLSWSLPIYCEAARVPYLFHGHNACGRCRELETAPITCWTGPKGSGSVLVYSNVYNQALRGDPKKVLGDYVAKNAERVKPDRFPILLQANDFSLASLDLAIAAKTWNENNFPRVQIATLEMTLSELARRQTAEKTPTVSKTGPCQWMDQPITDALGFGRARVAAETLPAAEKIASFAMASQPVKGGYAYPWFDLTLAWHNLLSNYEHTIGAACWRCKNAEGWRHYETEQVEHREESYIASAKANGILTDALGRMAQRIDAKDGTLVVFNPLDRTRTDVVVFGNPAHAGKNLAAVDDATGAVTPCQWIGNDTLAFVAGNVPALGYRTFHLIESALPVVQPVTNTVENAFYRITLDPATGTIASIVDKELGRELVKKAAPHGFNQYMYQWFDAAAKAKTDSHWSGPQADAQIAVKRGPVADVLRIRAKAKGVEWLEQTITLWHAVKRIDFALRLDKRPSGRSLLDYAANNLKGKESVFAALPFDIPGFKAVYQTGGGGVAEPVRDQFRDTGTAFHAVQHFADLSNDQFGVTVSPVDCALVEFGFPRSDALSRAIKGGETAYEKSKEYPKDSSLYLYLMDNMFTTNIRIDQRGEHSFHWALRSHGGDWQKGKATQFGEAVHQPLRTALVSRPNGVPDAIADRTLPSGAHSFASVDADNVVVSTLKPAEINGDGFIVRLVETEGRATTARLQLPFLGGAVAANETTLTETDVADAPAFKVAGDVVEVVLPPFGVKTLRVKSGAAPCAQVRNVTAKSISDMEVELAWMPVEEAAYYRIYRGDKADLIPSALTLVGITGQPRLLDCARNHGTSWISNRLAPATTYYYRVEAVSRHNLRGSASASVAASTLLTSQKACVPSKVEDLHAMLVSPIAPVNQINLLWRSNVEPNIAAYEIHRSLTAGFTPSQATLLAKQEVQTSARATGYKGFDHQMFLDTQVAPATTYYYKVRAVTQAGRPGAFSTEASATTKADSGPDSLPTPTTPPPAVGPEN